MLPFTAAAPVGTLSAARVVDVTIPAAAAPAATDAALARTERRGGWLAGGGVGFSRKEGGGGGGWGGGVVVVPPRKRGGGAGCKVNRATPAPPGASNPSRRSIFALESPRVGACRIRKPCRCGGVSQEWKRLKPSSSSQPFND